MRIKQLYTAETQRNHKCLLYIAAMADTIKQLRAALSNALVEDHAITNEAQDLGNSDEFFFLKSPL